MSTHKEITLRSGTGAVKGRVWLVEFRSVGLKMTHNGDGFYQRAVGVDYNGVAYETKPRGGGWRRAEGKSAAAIRKWFYPDSDTLPVIPIAAPNE